MTIKGAVFDLDGTLLDSMPMWDHAPSRFVKSRGLTPSESLDLDVVSLNMPDTAAYIRKNYLPNESCEQIAVALNKSVEDAFLYELELKDGAADFLRALHKNSVRLCVATATDRHLVEAVLKRHKIFDLFDGIITCSEVGEGKNVSALIFERALEITKSEKENTLIFEDSLYAIKPALKAGFMVAGIYDEYSRDKVSQMKKCCRFFFENWQQAKGELL